MLSASRRDGTGPGNGRSSTSVHSHMNKITLTTGLLSALASLQDDFAGRATVTELQMTPPVYANFASLRYWGLISPVFRDDGTRSAGEWEITDEGRKFLSGSSSLPSSLWREKGEFLYFDEQAPLRTWSPSIHALVSA